MQSAAKTIDGRGSLFGLLALPALLFVICLFAVFLIGVTSLALPPGDFNDVKKFLQAWICSLFQYVLYTRGMRKHSDFAIGCVSGIFGLLFLSSLGATAAPANTAFFPIDQGDAWVYATQNKEKKDTFEMKVKIDGTWEDGAESGVIMVQKDTRGQMREFLLQNEKGFFIKKLGLKKSYTPEVFTRFNPPVPRVIFPLEPGTKVHWEGRLKVATINRPIIFDGTVVGWEDVEVPAGKYHCIKLHYHEKRGNDVIDEDAWYAEGVGQVKYDGGQFVKELKSFTSARQPESPAHP
jgi:hypothetical protein